MTLAVLALAAQVTLAPCQVEGVAGEARCGTYRVWENRETRQGRQIDLYGTSYGSRVAQIYMQRHPSSLRAVAIKGIVPPSMASPESHARAGEAAWTNLVARCKDDPDCARTFPTVDADFRQLLARLDKAPVLTLPASSGRPEAAVRVTRGLFAEAFRNLLYTPEASAQTPKLVRQMLACAEWPRGRVAYSVSQRSREFGIRMAPGARAAQIVNMVVLHRISGPC